MVIIHIIINLIFQINDDVFEKFVFDPHCQVVINLEEKEVNTS